MTRSTRVQRWLFGRLLRVYPAWFRRAHAAEMEDLFLARLDRARNVRAVAALWMRVLTDAVSTVLAFRRQTALWQHPSATRKGQTMLWQDLRHGLRHLARSPLFAASVVMLLAIGIGANVAVFTLVDRLLLRPVPYDRPEDVVRIRQDSDTGVPSSNAFPAYRDMAALGFFESVMATSPSSAAWEDNGPATDVVIEYTTSSHLAVAGLPVLRGRWFSTEHDVIGGEAVAVVSAATWRARFDADPDVIGRTIRLNGTPVTIIGIGPERLTGSYPPVVTDFFLSISANTVGGGFRVANLERREDHWYDVRARLAPGTTVEQARAVMNTLAARLSADYPALDGNRGITVVPMREVGLYPQSLTALALASAMTLTLLLLTCANLANLLLVRGIGRSGEIAIRRAMGAGSLQVARLYLVESVLLSAAGGAAGVALAHLGLAAIRLAPLPYPFSATLDLAIDFRILVFAVSLTAATGILFGLAPALRSFRANVADALRDDSRTASLGRGMLRLRNGLVVLQVAGSFLLILVTGLQGRSLMSMQGSDPGIDADRVAYVRTSFTRAGLDGPAAATALDDVLARMRALPGVTHAAASSRLPAQNAGTTTTIVDDYRPPTGLDAVELDFTIVTPGYFDTVGQPLIQGRDFTTRDVAGADRVIVINATAARVFWDGIDPIGRRIRPQSQPDIIRTVVGVVADAPVSTYPERPSPPMFFVPSGQGLMGAPYLLARTDGDPGAILSPVRDALAGISAAAPINAQGTLAAHFGDALAVPQFAARAVGAVSLIAMLLAAVGIYSVVAFNVARRTSELGIRVALGARPGRVVRMIVTDTIGSVSLGVVVGLLISIPVASQLRSLLFGIGPLDPIAFGGTVILLTAIAVVAAYWPARRAAHIDPVKALRSS